MILLSILVAQAVARSVRPACHLPEAGKPAKRGDYYAVQKKVRQSDEIGLLGWTFNVTEVLKEKERERALGGRSGCSCAE